MSATTVHLSAGARRGVAVITAMLALVLGARAGTITESPDAGGMPNTAAVLSGTGSLDAIIGSLGTSSDVDMFQIFIANPAAFSATTETPNSAGWAWDTQLFLFDESGYGIWANDDIHNGDGQTYNPRSLLAAGSPGGPMTPGIYYLAISGWDRDPVNADGTIFTDDSSYMGTLAAAGPGASLPIAGWDGDGNLNTGLGAYTITLTGAEYASTGAVPEPGTVLLFVAVGALVHFAQRHRATASLA